MKIILQESEIHEALVQYITDNQNIDLSTRSITVELVAGRNPRGHSAEINILPLGAAVQQATETEGLDIDLNDPDDPDLKSKQAINFDFSVTDD